MKNVYNNDIFFKKYKQLRSRKNKNMNDLMEMPKFVAQLPNLKGMRVLDLGCGFGEHCKKYIELGAVYVLGIDSSERMLEVAKVENPSSRIQYQLLEIEKISKIQEKFDIVVSSLAFHYIADFDTLLKDIYNLLVDNGILLFSQEHPMNTCFTAGERW